MATLTNTKSRYINALDVTLRNRIIDTDGFPHTVRSITAQGAGVRIGYEGFNGIAYVTVQRGNEIQVL